MLGKIVEIKSNGVTIEATIDLDKTEDLLGLYVSMKSKTRNIIGEIMDIKSKFIYVNLLGEIIEDDFVFGVIRKPSFSSEVTLLEEEVTKKIIGITNYNEREHLYIGTSPIYQKMKLGFNIDTFFSGHIAIFGSTGSGKSCGISNIFQKLFSKQVEVPYRASIFIFDAYGEYHSAFKDLSKVVPEISFKTYTTNLKFPKEEVLKIPLWLLTTDDIALLLGAEKHTQLPIIEKALKLVSVFARDNDEVLKSKNDIIARAILDMLSSGKQAAQIRDQIVSVLSYYNTKELNLESIIHQPGYDRSLKQCLIIDATGKIREMELVMNFMRTFLTDDYELVLPDGTFMYTLEDLRDAFDFALISEGILNSNKVYDEMNILKVRLNALLNSEYSYFFDYPEYITQDKYIKKLLTASNGMKAQVINFNINYVDDRLAKNITKIFSRMLFDFAKDIDDRASMPFHIILEEAHRYVQNDNDKFLLGYNIFERISKEGRKYGVLLGLISQRPSELSETCLSQCNNFMIYKMLHPRDVDYIREMVPNITDDVVKRIRILQPGTCMAFGTAFKLPTLIKMDMPNPAPSSNSTDIKNTWFVTKR